MDDSAARTYAHPEVLVDTDWVAANLTRPDLRVFEVDEDVLLYHQGHVPGALKLDWLTELQRADVRDFIGPAGFASLMEAKGLGNDTTVILYGDKSNWWAAYAFWFFKYCGHRDVRLMNGGRQKWVAEGRPLETAVPPVARGSYAPSYQDASIRAFAPDVMKHLLSVARGRGALVDVRSEAEYTGERLHMPDYPQEGALRGGHIPGAVSVPWSLAANADGTFKSAAELAAVYEGAGVSRHHDVVAYCRIAERSSHTWFVLRYLLGYPRVRNYDGSWTEWGNLVGAPITRGREP